MKDFLLVYLFFSYYDYFVVIGIYFVYLEEFGLYFLIYYSVVVQYLFLNMYKIVIEI